MDFGWNVKGLPPFFKDEVSGPLGCDSHLLSGACHYPTRQSVHTQQNAVIGGVLPSCGWHGKKHTSTLSASVSLGLGDVVGCQAEDAVVGLRLDICGKLV